MGLIAYIRYSLRVRRGCDTDIFLLLRAFDRCNFNASNQGRHESMKICRWLLGGTCALASIASASVNTPGQFAVSESGAATFTVPIQVPRGIAGMEPNLSLSYTSGGGNGLLGLGWMINGISAVTRCPPTWATDRVRAGISFADHPAVNRDRYCLDGQRLILTDAAGSRTVAQDTYGAGATEYRTERESFSRVRLLRTGASGAPDGFRVWTTSGLVLDFGLICSGPTPTATCSISQNSRVPNHLGIATVNRWMIERIWDRNGNFVEFRYCRGRVVDPGNEATGCNTAAFQGSTVVSMIRYTSRVGVVGRNVVLFHYEDRTDKVPSFHAGSMSVQLQRLKTIESFAGWSSHTAPGSRAFRYELAYDTLENRATNSTRLVSITQVGIDGKTGLHPLTFVWETDGVFGQGASVPTVPSSTPITVPARPGFDSCGGTLPTQQMCP